ncbi:universal stress protein [Nocardiopsis sp. NPDC050513]|uniref:universal stress protein n=1 Tax=Nocardiopsis sp. NPDC050513 TaxID=3364338 RepID=UPI0037BB99D6
MMESVLVGVDRSDGSRRAVEFALKRARLNQWRVTIAHVVTWSPFSLRSPEDNESRSAARRAEVARAREEVIDPVLTWAGSQDLLTGVTVATAIRHGRPSEVLADLADQDDHGLVFVSRTGESNLRTAIFGSTASRLVQHAPVAVVVVP